VCKLDIMPCIEGVIKIRQMGYLYAFANLPYYRLIPRHIIQLPKWIFSNLFFSYINMRRTVICVPHVNTKQEEMNGNKFVSLESKSSDACLPNDIDNPLPLKGKHGLEVMSKIISAFEDGLMSKDGSKPEVFQIVPEGVSAEDALEEGVITLSLDLRQTDLRINGYFSKSPLSNYALFSTEVVYQNENDKLLGLNGKYLNLFEIMVPDDPEYKRKHSVSRANDYVNQLHSVGLSSSGVHFHWNGAVTVSSNVDGSPRDSWPVAVHHQNVGLDPIVFASLTADALSSVGVVSGSN